MCIGNKKTYSSSIIIYYNKIILFLNDTKLKINFALECSALAIVRLDLYWLPKISLASYWIDFDAIK
jgi:hypothetical protein